MRPHATEMQKCQRCDLQQLMTVVKIRLKTFKDEMNFD